MKNLILLKLTLYAFLLLLFTTCSEDDKVQYQLSTEVTPAEAGTLSPASGLFNEGTEVELKATPNQEYVFKNWAGDASGDVNPMKIIMVEDKDITAVFEKVNYSLTVDVIGEGTVEQEVMLAKSTSKDYESGTTIQLSAIPDDQWRFVEWSGDHVGNENPIQLTMDQAMSITAKFEKVSYALTLEIKGNGTVKEEVIQEKVSSKDYISGTTVQLTAEPDEEWLFVGWSGDHNSTKNPTQITIERAMKIVANFELANQEKTYVPDDNFEKALIDLGLDDVLDDYVNEAAISLVEELNISNKNISDMTGLEDFKSLITLDASYNNISSIDPFFGSSFGYGFIVGTLILNNNKLSSLDVSSLHILGLLDVTNNPLNCIQVNENQLSVIENGGLIPMMVKKDEGVIISEDCGS